MNPADVKLFRQQLAKLSPSTLEQVKTDFAAGPFIDDLAWLEPKRLEVGAALIFFNEMTAFRAAVGL
jgi:hypothetical protein